MDRFFKFVDQKGAFVALLTVVLVAVALGLFIMQGIVGWALGR
jgi:hypothetical protein